MTFIFWQGIISIHQKTFLEALATQPGVSKVMLVAENDISPYRKNMGWQVPQFNGVDVIVAPSAAQIDELFSANKDAVHILGGLRTGKMMTAALQTGIRLGAKLGLMSEPYDRSGYKGKLRDLKYYIYKLRYFKSLNFCLAIGKEGVRTYADLGFANDRLFGWGYFITVPIPAGMQPMDTNVRRIMFAGRIEEGKGIASFVHELANAGGTNYQLDIYGAGPDEEKIRNTIVEKGLESRIRISPFLKYDDMVQQYGNYDWVVLPSSRKDGWGVIVSEGLLNGLKAVCSNICGVSWAIKDHFNGLVFDWSEEGSCKHAIHAMLHDNSFADRADIKEWADKALSANAGAKYFLRVIDCVYHGKRRPEVPWAF